MHSPDEEQDEKQEQKQEQDEKQGQGQEQEQEQEQVNAPTNHSDAWRVREEPIMSTAVPACTDSVADKTTLG